MLKSIKYPMIMNFPQVIQLWSLTFHTNGKVWWKSLTGGPTPGRLAQFPIYIYSQIEGKTPFPSRILTAWAHCMSSRPGDVLSNKTRSARQVARRMDGELWGVTCNEHGTS